MKTILTILMMMFIVNVSFAQDLNISDTTKLGFRCGIGVAINSSIDVGTSSNIGVRFDLGINKFHFDIAGNLARGEGEHLYKSFSGLNHYATKSSDVGWTQWHIGYSIKKLNNLAITPKLGFIHYKNIYNRYITYYTESSGTDLSVGVDFNLLLNKAYITIGGGYLTSNDYSIGLSVGFIL